MADVISASTGAGGLGTPAARWSLVFGWACGIMAGFVSNTFASAPLLWLTACLAALAAVLLITLPGNKLLSPLHSLWVVLIGGYVTAVALATADGIGYLWALGLAGYLSSFLIARGNVIAGATSAVALLAMALLWALPQMPNTAQLGALLGIPVGVIAAGVAWRLVLRWIVTQERAHRSDAARSAERASASARALAASHAELAAIRTVATPLLERIVAGERVGETFRAELVRTEAAVRDRICAPHLQQPVLIEAIERLRSAGVAVVVLGESPEPGQVIDTRLAQTIADLLVPVTSGRVTLRTLPSGRAAAMSVVIQDERHSQQVRLTASGTTVSRR